MNRKPLAVLTVLAAAALILTGMARQGQYDEEAREAERRAKQIKKEERSFSNPARGIASGVKTAAVESTAGFVSETAVATRDEAPIIGTLEGARAGSQKVLDGAVKGAVKVATLGQADLQNYEVIDPESNTEETTKIRIKIPGT